MHPRHLTIWLLLGILPYLGLSLFGEIVHPWVHHASAGAAHAHARQQTPDEGALRCNGSCHAGADLCPIGKWGHASIACGLMPAAFAPASSICLQAPMRPRQVSITCIASSPSRAPPSFHA